MSSHPPTSSSSSSSSPPSSPSHENPHTNPAERKHFYSVLSSYLSYRASAHHAITHVRRQNFYALPQSHWQLLAGAPINYLDTLERIDDAIDKNAEVAERIYEAGVVGIGAEFIAGDPSASSLMSFDSGQSNEGKAKKLPWEGTAAPLDNQKARSTINQFYRDWSVEGARERNPVFEPIFTDLASFCAPGASVLIPGVGLGRLMVELAARGYKVEGNEISYHQLLASHWVLNNTTKAKEYQNFPFIGNFSNRLTRDAQLRSVRIPDIVPAEYLAEAAEEAEKQGGPKGELGMSMGDFVEVYSREENTERFDSVVSLFFIDTAPDFVRYIEVVRIVLRVGGVWCNVGPLLWHFDGSGPSEEGQDGEEDSERRKKRGRIGDYGSVELSNEEVLEVLKLHGFEVLKVEQFGRVGYVEDEAAMLRHEYEPVHWVARKVS